MGLFYTVLSEALDIFLPLHKVNPQQSKRPTPWFNDNIQQPIKSKNKAKRQADRSSDPSDRSYFQQLKNELKTSIRQVKIDYLQVLMQWNRSNPAHAADVWSHVNNLFGRNTHSSADPMDLSTLNSINDHFQTVAISSDHEGAASFVILPHSLGSEPFTFSDITVSLVHSHLQQLDPKKSTGPDGLSARFLKAIANGFHYSMFR